LLHHPKQPRSSTVSLHDLVGALKLVFASVAGAGALVALVTVYQRQRKIRHPVIRVIAAHLREDAAVAWRGLDLDFTGAVLTAEASRATCSPAEVSFSDAKFSGGTVAFGGAVFFNATVFSGGNVYF
jgi:hypothetical protein